MTNLLTFLSGSVVACFAVCSLVFLSFWRQSRDDLFLAFALAFAFLGAGQATSALLDIPTEDRGYIYLFRLAAFGIILIAVGRKNFGRS